MRIPFTLLFFLVGIICFCQNKVEWEPDIKLSFSDFASQESEINESLSSTFISSGANLEFGYQMSNAQFMFTKNFNSMITAVFNRSAAVITAVDSLQANNLVAYGQYTFDLSELYARKFRKRLYENKSAFSGADYYKPIFNEIQEEMNTEVARVSKLTELGSKRDILSFEHQKVLEQIDGFPEFCKSCKPKKKKKSKN